jgi:ABC-type sugar transport system ATPase subunit
VEENLAFGLRARGVQREERKARVDEVAGGLGLTEFLWRRPGTLSGGEKQRVVLGRTLAVRAKVTLLDEPTTGIDPERREGLLADLIRLHGELGGTWVLVTHDQAEAQAFGDRVAVMRAGRIVQVGEPRSLYEEPVDRFVGKFVGDPGMNLVRCRVEVKEALVTLWGLVPGAGWELPESLGATGLLRERGTGEVDLGWRAEEIGEIAAEGAGVGDVALVGGVVRRVWRGPRYLVEARVGGHPVKFWSSAGLEAGERVAIRFKLGRAYGFDPESGARIFGPGTA